MAQARAHRRRTARQVPETHEEIGRRAQQEMERHGHRVRTRKGIFHFRRPQRLHQRVPDRGRARILLLLVHDTTVILYAHQAHHLPPKGLPLLPRRPVLLCQLSPAARGLGLPSIETPPHQHLLSGLWKQRRGHCHVAQLSRLPLAGQGDQSLHPRHAPSRPALHGPSDAG